MYYRVMQPGQLGHMIEDTARDLVQDGQQLAPGDALYCEKRGGFQCRSCRYVSPTNQSYGHCQVVQGSIHLDDGCCVLWSPDPGQLHLYRDARTV